MSLTDGKALVAAAYTYTTSILRVCLTVSG
jgi:hypothetical protein